MHRIAFVLLASLGTVTVCFAQDVARMDHVVQSYASNGTFAGSVLVARGNDVIVSKGYGLANVEWNIPSTPSARFKVASITKQFTAAAGAFAGCTETGDSICGNNRMADCE